jgi:hypothetical protein
LERLALNRIREQFPGMKRKGFSGAVRAACAGEGLPQVPIIPDAWMVDGDYLTGEDRGKPATFTCFEIEDRHPLSPEKLWFYCGLYDTLDFCGHNLRLFVFDRYGHNKRELDLCVLYLDGVIEMTTGPPY